MSKRFQNLNKYRNAVGAPVKKESWYPDVPAEKSSSDVSPLIQANASWLSLKWSGNGAMALLALDNVGKGCANQALVFHAHAAPISDWCFSPFDDQILATAGEDAMIKLWKLPHTSQDQPTCTTTLSSPSRYVSCLVFHPTADQVLCSLGNDGKKISLWDVQQQSCTLSLSGAFHSFSWNGVGDRLATSGQGTVQVWDPRANDPLIHTGKGHEAIKGSRVTWMGDSPYLFSVGMNKMRSRQYHVWDSRYMNQPIITNPLGSSTGTLLPLYDQDTETMYLVSRGDATIRSLQFDQTMSTPTVAENMACGTNASVLGATLAPKSVLDVMNTEVARLLALTTAGVVPISYHIPRKQYIDFHSELFPDTNGSMPALTATDWFNGKTEPLDKVSLDPKKRQTIQKPKHAAAAPSPAQQTPTPEPSPSTALPAINAASNSPTNDKPAAANAPASNTTAGAPASESNQVSSTSISPDVTPAAPLEPAKPAAKTVPAASLPAAGVPPIAKKPAKPLPVYGTPQASMFKYIGNKVYHPSTHFTDLKDLDVSKGANVVLVQANEHWLAVPLSGAGGRVGVLPTAKPGRLPVHVPAVATGADIAFFLFDPFDTHILTTVSLDNKILHYRLPTLDECDGDMEKLHDCLASLSPFASWHDSTMDKVSLLAYHPTASGVLASVSTDFGSPTVRVWHDGQVKHSLAVSHQGADAILSLAWSPDGTRIATVSKDKQLRIVDARTDNLLQKGKAHALIRPSRLAWLDSQYLVSVGFGTGCFREVLLFDANCLDAPVAKRTLEMSPGVMDLHVDRDCQIIYICGRGDRIIHAFGLTESKNEFLPLTNLEFGSLQQGFAFLPKTLADVKEVELSRYYRLTPHAIEVLGVRLPRARPEFFQDDVFVPTEDTTHAALDGASWCAGQTKSLVRLSLQPIDMVPLSEAPPPERAARAKAKFEMGKQQVSMDQRREETMKRMFATAKDVDKEDEERIKKEQTSHDHEDVDEDEWDD
ncbi:DUF1900-domain-containing protein [Hesseltinella vesiculosa]|uniref:Coronin n=1 Tax=Hesseltinella vesiculosa TaxID=101127 RepID=A0A1X2GRP9_9FUNG|nr:DUF1900-domain-containing protein [Hesseltinella vesiculosa]